MMRRVSLIECGIDHLPVASVRGPSAHGPETGTAA